MGSFDTSTEPLGAYPPWRSTRSVCLLSRALSVIVRTLRCGPSLRTRLRSPIQVDELKILDLVPLDEEPSAGEVRCRRTLGRIAVLPLVLAIPDRARALVEVQRSPDVEVERFRSGIDM